MKRLLMFDFFRGPDSTGFAAIDKDNGSAKIVKIASHPLDLFDMKKFTSALSGFNSSVFIGHNRLATKGGVNTINAHPYQFDHIVGAHNGTLDHSSWKALEEAVGDKFEVDSQAVFAAIAKIGIDETVKLLQGAWALVWHDRSKGTLNFLRNKERPFWYSYTKDFTKVFWASEWHMISAATGMSTSPYELFTDKDNFKFFGTKADWLYSFNLDELRKGSEARPKPRVKELKGKEPAPAYQAKGHDPFGRGGSDWKNWNKPTISTTTSRGSQGGTTTDKDPEVIHLSGSKTSPLGGYITKLRFQDLAKHGCSWCSATIEYEEVGVSIYEAQGAILCPDCSLAESGQSRVHVEDLKQIAC